MTLMNQDESSQVTSYDGPSHKVIEEGLASDTQAPTDHL